jgi:hypothetical protein
LIRSVSFLAAVLAQAAASEAPPATSCPDVLDYATWNETPGQLWDFRSPTLTIIGIEHSRDPSHEQFTRIAAEFTAARPTRVYFEGPDRGIAEDRDETIRNGGESAFARLLARESGISARSLEPSPSDQMQALAGRYPMEQVLLFFVLREASRLRDREGRTREALDSAVGSLLGRVSAMAGSAGVKLPFGDVAGLQAAFERYWPGSDWREADAKWFSPRADDRHTGGQFMAAINRADSSNRDRHMVKLFTDAVRRGERLFVVVSPALSCAIAEGVSAKTVKRD